MDRHSAVTSSRRQFPILSDIVSGGKRILFMEYGESKSSSNFLIFQETTGVGFGKSFMDCSLARRPTNSRHHRSWNLASTYMISYRITQTT